MSPEEPVNAQEYARRELSKMETVPCHMCHGSGGYYIERLIGTHYFKCDSCKGFGRVVPKWYMERYEKLVKVAFPGLSEV